MLYAVAGSFGSPSAVGWSLRRPPVSQADRMSCMRDSESDRDLVPRVEAPNLPAGDQFGLPAFAHVPLRIGSRIISPTSNPIAGIGRRQNCSTRSVSARAPFQLGLADQTESTCSAIPSRSQAPSRNVDEATTRSEGRRGDGLCAAVVGANGLAQLRHYDQRARCA